MRFQDYETNRLGHLDRMEKEPYISMK